jgi:hypothetical protein
LKLQVFYSGLFLVWTKGMQVVSHFSPLITPARTVATPRPQAEAIAAQPQPVSPETRKHAAMAQPAIGHNSAMLSESLIQKAAASDPAVVLPAADSPRVLAAIDSPRVLAAIEQYKWQMLDDEVKPRSNYWA